MEATSRRTARKVIKKLIDARNILRCGRSGRLACRIRPSLVRWSSNSMAAVTRTMKSSSIHSPDKCMAYYSTKCGGGAVEVQQKAGLCRLRKNSCFVSGYDFTGCGKTLCTKGTASA